MSTESIRNILTPAVIFVALFNMIFHFVFAGNLEYHRDELLYFSPGQHPDFGYIRVPPLISWSAALTIEMPENSAHPYTCAGVRNQAFMNSGRRG